MCNLNYGLVSICVDDDAPNDPGPGNPLVSDPDEDGSPDHPFDAIQEGINAAWHGDEVVVCDGTYTGAGNRDLDFLDRRITVRSQSDNPAACIIDSEGGASDPHRGFDFQSGENELSVLRGVTIRNGYGGFGGAISCGWFSSPTIINCVFEENVAEWGAGVECDNGCSPTIINCTFADNIASYGGAIDSFDNSHPKITNRVIAGNIASSGGGLCCWYASSPMVTDCTFAGNHGGVYVQYDPGHGPRISNSILWDDLLRDICSFR